MEKKYLGFYKKPIAITRPILAEQEHNNHQEFNIAKHTDSNYTKKYL